MKLLNVKILMATLLLFSTGAVASVTCSGEVHLKQYTIWPFTKTVRQFGPAQGSGNRANDAIRATQTNLVPYKSQCFQEVATLGGGWCEVEITDCYGVNGF